MPTALEEFERKTTVPSWARTADWQAVPAQIRRRSFFSAAVTDANLLADERQSVADLLQAASKDGKLYRRDTAITELQRLAKDRWLDTGRPDALTNPAAEQRIKLVLDINRAQAQGYARFKRSSSGGALLAFPAQELIRVRDSDVKRDWQARWIAAGGKLVDGRMIALKTDPIWTHPAVSRFGVPYPPFDFNSGMGVRDISRREAIALGIIAADYQPESDPVADLNNNLEAAVDGVDSGLLDTLASMFGDALKIIDGKARLIA